MQISANIIPAMGNKQLQLDGAENILQSYEHSTDTVGYSHQDFQREGRVQGPPVESSFIFVLFSASELSSIIGLAGH